MYVMRTEDVMRATDAAWEELQDNDAATVIAALEAAYADNDA